jgi:hypothetical protein
MNLSPEESVLVAAMQESLANAKAAMRDLEKNARRMATINREAGRMGASNAAMKMQGEAMQIRGHLIVAHAEASDALCQCFDDGGIVIQGGGGGR